jgi:hypothetical protein
MEPPTVEAHSPRSSGRSIPSRACTNAPRRLPSVVISRPGCLPKSLILPKDLVRGGLTKSEARRALRDILLTAFCVDRSQGTIQPSHETVATTEPAVPWPWTCPRCSKEIQRGESVRFEHGAVRHILCEPR